MEKFTFATAAEWMSLTQELPAKTRITLFDALTHYVNNGEMPQLPQKDLFIFKLLLQIVTNKFTHASHEHTPATCTTATTNTTTTEKNIEKKNCSSNSNEVKEVVAEVAPATHVQAQAPATHAQAQAPAPSAPCTEEELAAYFTACKLPNAKDQAHQCFAFNEARGWMQGGRRITTLDGWHWIAQCWIRQAAKFPAPPKAPLTDDEIEENRRARDEEEAREKARKAIIERWNDVRNIVCLAHKDDYMTVFHPIRIIDETDTQVIVRATEDIYQRLLTEPFRTTLLNAVKRVYGNKELRVQRTNLNQLTAKTA